MRNKNSYTIRDMYKTYHKINKDVPYVRFKRILDECNKNILDIIIIPSPNNIAFPKVILQNLDII